MCKRKGHDYILTNSSMFIPSTIVCVWGYMGNYMPVIQHVLCDGKLSLDQTNSVPALIELMG